MQIAFDQFTKKNEMKNTHEGLSTFVYVVKQIWANCSSIFFMIAILIEVLTTKL
jgi:hypothetical protein